MVHRLPRSLTLPRVAGRVYFVALCLWLHVHFALSAAPATLRFVNVLFRHGNRSPMRTFVNDIYQEDSWPQGFGQLTSIGLRHGYELGQFIRKRYTGFLNDSYIASEMYTFSTDVDRTLQTAAVVLAGLYASPAPDRTPRVGLPWQPIPIHSIYNELFTDQAACPRRKALRLEMKNMQLEYLDTHYADYLSSLRNLTGVSDIELNGVGSIMDSLFCEKADGRVVPDWADDYMNVYYAEIGPHFMRTNFDTLEKRRLFGDTVLLHMITEMGQHIDGTDLRKLVLYSVHDANLVRLLASLKVFNYIAVPFSAAVFLELHQGADDGGGGGHFVRVLYRNETNGDANLLTIPGCDADCPFDRFLELTRNVTAARSSDECGGSGYMLDRFLVVVIASVTAGVFMLVASLVGLMFACRRRPLWCMNTREQEQARHHHKLYERSAAPEEVPMMMSDESA